MKRHATAVWKGSIKEGSGSISSQSGVLDKTQYSFKSRFEEGKGTNPEELVAAAHAGCFAMQLSAFLTEEDFEVGSLETKGEVTLKDGNITNSHLILKAKIENIEKDKFDELVEKAEKNCPISKLLDTKISVEATLI
ncbi:OsmC family peroxiredoxin [Psychroflexus sp. CAK57W]|uniref:OsmC family peroxiredoxin n=1 Tax=Psychroflexus curvus TaxID=2873595 RepID=UPI001CCEEBE6|nr:OsmC family peroxiredoxin [Psychroflexus curvus]MBZ9628964.1 OsmC family peroxiredoxin [Psychroflexus curvus]MBZ9787350.1 OsmC family peroxiredoxin [Psychroflexus curvus]